MASHPKQADLEALLNALNGADVAFIVVGGAAAVLHGAPITTLDIVHDRSPENIERPLGVLKAHDSKLRDPAGRSTRPTAEQLAGNGQLSLSTSLGPLDPLCRLRDGRDYEDLKPRSIVLSDNSL